MWLLEICIFQFLFKNSVFKIQVELFSVYWLYSVFFQCLKHSTDNGLLTKLGFSLTL